MFAFQPGGDVLAVDEAPLPHFQIHERPKPFRIVCRAVLMLVYERAHELRIEDTSLPCAAAENIFIQNVGVCAAEP